MKVKQNILLKSIFSVIIILLFLQIENYSFLEAMDLKDVLNKLKNSLTNICQHLKPYDSLVKFELEKLFNTALEEIKKNHNSEMLSINLESPYKKHDDKEDKFIGIKTIDNNEKMKALFEEIKKCNKLKVLILNLRNNPLDNEQIVTLSKYLKSLLNLKTLYLDLTGSPIKSDNFAFLMQSISDLKNLKALQLYIRNCFIGEGITKILNESLAKMISLESLALDLLGNINTNQTEGDDKEVANKNLDVGTTSIINSLTTLNFLKNLDLSFNNNSFGEKSAIAMKEALKNKKIKSLKLNTSSFLNKKSILPLGQTIISFKDTLENLELNMYSAGINEKKSNSLETALNLLENLKTLRLNFANNSIQNTGFLDKIVNLKKLTHLKLVLSKNNITVINQIKETMSMTNLTYLKIILAGNTISDFSSIANIIKSQTNLKTLHLDISENNAENIDLLPKPLNDSITKLDISIFENRNIKTESIQELVKKIKNHQNLQTIKLSIPHKIEQKLNNQLGQLKNNKKNSSIFLYEKISDEFGDRYSVERFGGYPTE
jgi:hypothetical protein